MVGDTTPWGDAEDEEEIPQEEPEEWHETVNCPLCGSTDVRLTERRHEVAVYLCERCNASFEVE